jgi:hypothetical protein
MDVTAWIPPLASLGRDDTGVALTPPGYGAAQTRED